jgi:phosphate transport system permease protein
MATESEQVDFGRVSRTKGVLFKYLSLGASVFGIVTLAVLLVYVFIDAFDLANASHEWLLTYFLTLVVPFTGFCLYSARDRQLAKRVALALSGGLVAVPLAFTAFETFVQPIPRLTWSVAYMFLVGTPVTGLAAFRAAQQPVGGVGFGLIGRLLAGTGLGIALAMLFHVFDPRQWFLVYTLGLAPAGVLYALSMVGPTSIGSGLVRSVPARVRPPLSADSLAAPVALAGVVAGVLLRDILRTYPTTDLIYLWTLAVPAAAVAGGLVYARGGSQYTAAVAGAVPLAAGGLGMVSGSSSLPELTAIIVFAFAAAPVTVFLYEATNTPGGLKGLVLPVVLVGGSLAGAAIVDAMGFAAPNSWLNFGYVTSAPSRNAAEAGLYPAIVGSIIVIALVAIFAFALGVGTAVFLEEYTSGSGVIGSITRIIQVNIANLAAVPSVVYGLLGLGLFANLMGFGYGTVVTASLTLTLLILPITIVSAQEAIRAVPDEMRRGSEAMGATRWQTTKNIVLPQALPGILTGIILSLGRAIGETAPLIMIGAATTVFNPPFNIMSKISAMPMQIYAWSDYAVAEFRYGVVAAGVTTLLVVLLGMNATAIVLRNRSESDT